MKNYGLLKYQNSDVNNFTTDRGLANRRKLDRFMSSVLNMAAKLNLIKYGLEEEKVKNGSISPSGLLRIVKESGIKIMNYPELEKGEAYIFASLHNFVDDSMANLASTDRNAYLFFGTTEQLQKNKDMYAAWANGFVYVDRKNEESRKSSIDKLERVLNSKNSVVFFPEGYLNNSFNTFSNKLFYGVYNLSRRTKVKVVPVAPLYEYGSYKIHMNYGEPIELYNFEDKKEAMLFLRDTLATLFYENLLENSEMLVRKNLGKEPKLDYLEKRRKEYLKSIWTKEGIEEELDCFRDKEDNEIRSIYEDISRVTVTSQNAKVIAPFLVRKREIEKYDFKDYIINNLYKK